MLWDHPVRAAWVAARSAGKPLVVSPHGSASEAWRRDALHKRLYRKFFLDGMLRELGAMHALNRHEAEQIRAWGYGGRVEVIPNGLPASEYGRPRDVSPAVEKWPMLKTRKVLLYMGRLWREKGLDVLLDAWADAGIWRDGWALALAGPDYRGFEKELRARAAAQGLEDSVLFTGLATGAIKDALFGAARCFVLPSRSEGFSMAILEAMAAGLPCIYTCGCHFPELAEAGGGWEIELAREALAGALREIVRMPDGALREKGLRAMELGRRDYTMESVGESLMRLYTSLTGSK